MLRTIASTLTTTPMHHLTKYMLLDYKIKPEYTGVLAGVIHVNGTARIQTLDIEEDNPFMYRLLSYQFIRATSISQAVSSYFWFLRWSSCSS